MIEIIKAAIAAIFGFKATIQALKDENTELRRQLGEAPATIADLQAKLAAEELDDSVLESAANEAKARAEQAEERATTLDSKIAEAEAAATELAKALNEDPETPSVDPETFEPAGGTGQEADQG